MEVAFGLFRDPVDFGKQVGWLGSIARQRFLQVFAGEFAVDIGLDALYHRLSLADPQPCGSGEAGESVGADHQQRDHQDHGQFPETDVEHRAAGVSVAEEDAA